MSLFPFDSTLKVSDPAKQVPSEFGDGLVATEVDTGAGTVGDGCVTAGDGCVTAGDGCVTAGDGCVTAGDDVGDNVVCTMLWEGGDVVCTTVGVLLEGGVVGGVVGLGNDVGLRVGDNVVWTMLWVGVDVVCTTVGFIWVGDVGAILAADGVACITGV
jgi:hypothetical protein